MQRFLILGICCLGLAAVPAAAHENPSDQVADLSHRLEQSPRDPDLHLQRGELHRLEGRWSAAAADFDQALACGAAPATVALCRAALELDRGRPEAAMVSLRQVDDGSNAALVVGARALRQLGRLPEAAAAMERAVAGSPRPRPEDYLEWSAIIAEQGDTFVPEALAALEAGSRRLGPVASLTQAAARLEVDAARYDAALERLAAAPPTLQTLPAWLARRGEILRLAGREFEAQVAFTEALAGIDALPVHRRATPAIAALEQSLRSALRIADDDQPGARP